MTQLTRDELAIAGDLIVSDIRRTPGYAFAATLLRRNPPQDAPPTSEQWVDIGWLANVVHLWLGPDVREETWAVALEESGIEVRLRGDRALARVSEYVILDMIDHQEPRAEREARRKRFMVFGDTPRGAAEH